MQVWCFNFPPTVVLDWINLDAGGFSLGRKVSFPSWKTFPPSSPSFFSACQQPVLRTHWGACSRQCDQILAAVAIFDQSKSTNLAALPLAPCFRPGDCMQRKKGLASGGAAYKSVLRFRFPHRVGARRGSRKHLLSPLYLLIPSVANITNARMRLKVSYSWN